ncbi:MAG: saccharopine dehydrogenase family protein [Steroidobacteraceae bacterium]
MRILVLGGSGNFGARIVRALAVDSSLELVAASRNGTRVPGAEDVPAVRLDMHAEAFAEDLKLLAPGLVVHCVGPFQGQDYRVARAALAAGAHYIDLADGREFVAQFGATLDAAARSAGRVAISGASTLPALSSAVVDSLRTSMEELESIEVVIAPGQKAPRGAATLEAVFSYLGRAFAVWEEGQWRSSFGWMDLRRVELLFGRRWAAACDVPDLALFPKRYSPVQSVQFHAALEMGIQHFFLWGLAALRRVGIPVPMARWAPALDRHAGVFDRWAGEWGGMSVRVRGKVNGCAEDRTWQLVAPALNGPEIPTFAAVLLARRLAKGESITSGANACMGYLDLAAFREEFDKWGIRTSVEGGSGS